MRATALAIAVSVSCVGCHTATGRDVQLATGQGAIVAGGLIVASAFIPGGHDDPGHVDPATERRTDALLVGVGLSLLGITLWYQAPSDAELARRRVQPAVLDEATLARLSNWLAQARSLAGKDDCGTVRRLGRKVKATSRAFYENAFRIDPALERCRLPRAKAPPPPSSTNGDPAVFTLPHP